MKKFLEFGLMSGLLLWSFGCSGESSAKVAADATAHAAPTDAHVTSKTILVTKPDVPARTRPLIPSGTPLKVSLVNAVDTGTSSAGERFWASLSEPVVVDGKTVLQQGTQLRGHIVAVEGS